MCLDVMTPAYILKAVHMFGTCQMNFITSFNPNSASKGLEEYLLYSIDFFYY